MGSAVTTVLLGSDRRVLKWWFWAPLLPGGVLEGSFRVPGPTAFILFFPRSPFLSSCLPSLLSVFSSVFLPVSLSSSLLPSIPLFFPSPPASFPFFLPHFLTSFLPEPSQGDKATNKYEAYYISLTFPLLQQGVEGARVGLNVFRIFKNSTTDRIYNSISSINYNFLCITLLPGNYLLI